MGSKNLKTVQVKAGLFHFVQLMGNGITGQVGEAVPDHVMEAQRQEGVSAFRLGMADGNAKVIMLKIKDVALNRALYMDIWMTGQVGEVVPKPVVEEQREEHVSAISQRMADGTAEAIMLTKQHVTRRDVVRIP